MAIEEAPWPRGLAGAWTGAGGALRGLGRVLSDPKSRLEAIIPIVLTGVLYVVAALGLAFGSGPLLGLLWDMPEAIGWLVLWWVARVTLALGLFLVLLLLFAAVVEALAGPFLEKSMIRSLRRAGIDPEPTPFWDNTLVELVRGIVFSVLAMVPVLLAAVPAIGVGFAVLAAVATSFGLGSGPWSAVLVLTGRRWRERMSWLWQQRMLVTGLGAISALGLLVPVLGWLVLPASHVAAAEIYGRLQGPRKSTPPRPSGMRSAVAGRGDS
jgi:uncharacterized protein involved in cysteine biosynthesis